MNKIFLISLLFGTHIFAGFSAQEAADLERKAADIRKALNIHTPTAEEKKLERIRHELKLDFDTSSKETLLDTHKAETVVSLSVPKKIGLIDSVTSVVTNAVDSLGNNNEETYSFTGTLNNFYDTVGLEKGENLGMPSVFGLNKKKEEKAFGLELVGDAHDVGTFIYKGMKYSGTSAEFTSGMMYRSSKVYNTMFGMFDDSPFNIFEKEDEKSVFDVFEGGNKVLDIFD
jgi:hypothetical protein